MFQSFGEGDMVSARTSIGSRRRSSERLEDIGTLAARIAVKHAERLGRTIERIDKKSLRLLESYDWPGNVRELENVVERAVIVSQHGTLRIERDFLEHLPKHGDVGQHLRNEEREAIESALRLSHGRIRAPMAQPNVWGCRHQLWSFESSGWVSISFPSADD